MTVPGQLPETGVGAAVVVCPLRRGCWPDRHEVLVAGGIWLSTVRKNYSVHTAGLTGHSALPVNTATLAWAIVKDVWANNLSPSADRVTWQIRIGLSPSGHIPAEPATRSSTSKFYLVLLASSCAQA
jgi:hypothetical protein